MIAIAKINLEGSYLLLESGREYEIKDNVICDDDGAFICRVDSIIAGVCFAIKEEGVL